MTIARRFALVIVPAAVLAVSLAGQASLTAHHSFASTYRDDTTVTFEGELVQVMFRNPHSFVQLVVTEKNGAQVRYALEWRGAGQLETQGVRHDTLRIGDRIVITGHPGRNPEDHRVRLTALERPSDGFTWRGSSGSRE